ncbi:MAG: hypothetical protein KTR30_02030 [Saprospiraceae bacterium]|nr:hypothetical protein [Saprospiraceae bacterium]
MLDQVQQHWMPWSAGIGFSLIVMLFCIRRPVVGRRLLAFVFLAGAVGHVYLAWIYPRDYLVFGQFTYLDSYRRFIYMILFRQATWMGGLMVVLHAYLAYVFWRKGALPKISILLSVLWLLLVAPLGFGSAFPASLLLLLGVIYLSKQPAELTEA